MEARRLCEIVLYSQYLGIDPVLSVCQLWKASQLLFFEAATLDTTRHVIPGNAGSSATRSLGRFRTPDAYREATDRASAVMTTRLIIRRSLSRADLADRRAALRDWYCRASLAAEFTRHETLGAGRRRMRSSQTPSWRARLDELDAIHCTGAEPAVPA